MNKFCHQIQKDLLIGILIIFVTRLNQVRQEHEDEIRKLREELAAKDAVIDELRMEKAQTKARLTCLTDYTNELRSAVAAFAGVWGQNGFEKQLASIAQQPLNLN